MKSYDVAVVGSGAGAIIVDYALSHNLKVALVDKGPLGGTCLNVGCIPSKILIVPADRVVEIQGAKKLGIHAEIKQVDFASIMNRMRSLIAESQRHIRMGLDNAEKLDFYDNVGTFVENYTLQVGGERIKAKKYYIASGARPLIPAIRGIEDIEYLTNETVLALTEKPESLIIIGGGYIAAEYGHFFSAMGTQVTILQRGERLVKEEEPEISALLEEEMGRRMTIFTQTEVEAVKAENGGLTVTAKNLSRGEPQDFYAQRVMVAAGRQTNADILKVENTGIKTDARGFIRVNDFFETSKENIWALGDAIGRKMFRHSANQEAEIVWHNSQHGEAGKLDYNTIPHAVFSYPPVASVGMVEDEAKKNYDILVGKADYKQVAKGEAMMEENGFAKIILEKDTGKILGFHIIGPYAPMLIQEVINAVASEGTVMPIIKGMHIHPALPEVIQATLGNLYQP
ncbi:MAG: dihydrolipoyl dehydrogenase [Candidatus Aminicenantes bacterium]